MNAIVPGLLLILVISLSVSGCCSAIEYAFVTPTPMPVATNLPTISAPPTGVTPTIAAELEPTVQGQFVASYDVMIAVQKESGNAIKITNIGGAGTQYLKYFSVTDNGHVVTVTGLTPQKGSVGTFVSNATADHIIISGMFIDGTMKPLMDTTIQT